MAKHKGSGAGKKVNRKPRSFSKPSTPRIGKALIMGGLVLFGTLFGAGVLVMRSGTLWPGDYNQGAFVFTNSYLYGGNANDIVVVTSDRGNHPEANEPVTITLGNSSGTFTIYEGKTDASGILSTQIMIPPQPENTRTVNLTIRANGESISKNLHVYNQNGYRGGFNSGSTGTGSGSGAGSGSEPAVVTQGPPKLYLTLDKPRYQPGQTIHLRTLSFWDGLTNTDNVTYEIKDPSGNKLFKKVMTPNKFGITYLDYPLNDILPQGEFKITVTSRDATSIKSVPVERYVLPKFNIQFGTMAEWYNVADIINGEFDVKYFFGKPVEGTAVIVATMVPRAYYWDMGSKVASGTRELLNTTNMTSPVINGKCTFTVPKASGSISSSYQVYDLSLSVAVTDTGGHTEKKSTTLMLTSEPYYISAITDTRTPGQPYDLTVMAQDVLGSPVKGANVNVKISGTGGRNLGSGVTNAKGLATITFVPTNESSLSITADFGEKGGHKYTQNVNTGLGNPSAIKITTDKRFYNAGETARVNIMADPRDDTFGVAGYTFVDVKVDGNVASHRVLKLENDRASFSFKVTEEMAPTLEIEASKLSVMSYGTYYQNYYGYYYYKRAAEPTVQTDFYNNSYSMARDRTAIGVGVRSQLDIAVNASKTELRPGEPVDLYFTVMNGSRPVSAALALAIVDEALLAMGGDSAFDEIRNDLMRDPGYEQYTVYSYIWNDYIDIMPMFRTSVFSNYGSDSGYLDYSSAQKQGDKIIDTPNSASVEGFAFAAALLGVVGYFGIIGLGIKYKKTLIALVASLVLLIGISPLLVNLDLTPQIKSFSDTSQPVSFSQYTGQNYYYGWGMEDMDGMRNGGIMPPMAPSANEKNTNILDLETYYGGSGQSSAPGGYLAPSRQVTVRTWFPELWYWNPLIVTDDNGQASIRLNAPDSITAWRIDALASTIDGRIGVGNGSLVVFQPFFVDPDLPASVVRNDKFTFKVQVYNYEPSAKSVSVKLQQADWFQTVGDDVKTVQVGANSVSWVDFTIKARKVGVQRLTVDGMSDTREDIVVRDLLVEPDGKLVEDIRNGLLVNSSSASMGFTLDARRVAASEVAYLKLQSSVESIILDGAQGFINVVSGCGEQSTSGLAVDILAFQNYMKGKTDAANVTRYTDILNKGIQHEAQYLSNNTNGNGRAIVWHQGEQPDLWLTAWAVQVYKDLDDAGFTVDGIIPDLQKYLASVQSSDGTWSFPDVGHWSINNELQSQKVAATAYMVRALGYSGMSPSAGAMTRGRQYLEANIGAVDDTFTHALTLEALLLSGSSSPVIGDLVQKLASAAKDEGNGAVSWRYSASGDWVHRYHRGDNTLETTGYAMMALSRAGTSLTLVQAGAKYLVLNRAGGGHYGSTHNTAVAFQALNGISEITPIKDLTIEVLVDGGKVGSVNINQQNKDLTFLTDLRPYFQSTDGSVAARTVNLTLRSTGEGGVFYHVYTKQNIEWSSPAASLKPVPTLTFSVSYGTNSTSVGTVIGARANVSYIGDAPALQMVLVDIKAPTGFSLDESDFRDLLTKGTINFYEYLGTTEVYAYIDMMKRNETRTLDYTLAAMQASTSLLQHVKAWDMYNTSAVAELAPLEFTSA